MGKYDEYSIPKEGVANNFFCKSFMEKVFGKEVDILKLKGNVLKDTKKQVDEILKIANHFHQNYTPVMQDNCYVCSGTESTDFAEVHGFTYVTCKDCGHLRTCTRYSDDAIKEFYKINEYYSKTIHESKESVYYRRDNVAKPKVEFLERYVDTQTPKGVWLDVGAGIGDLLSVVSEKGWTPVGLELNTSSIDLAKEYFSIDLLAKTLEQLPAEYEEQKVDVVSFMGLLEHTVNPLDLLRIARKILKPGGLVLIQVPSADSLACMIQSVYPENVFRQMSPVEHIMLFSQKSLVRSVEMTGFEPLAMWFHGLDVYELLNNLVLTNERVKNSPFFHAMIENMNELQLTFDKKELSDRMICVARAI